MEKSTLYSRIANVWNALVATIPSRFRRLFRREKIVTTFSDDFEGPPLNDQERTEFPGQYGFRATLPITHAPVGPEQVVNINIELASSNLTQVSRRAEEAMARVSESINILGVATRHASEAFQRFGEDFSRLSAQELIEQVMADESGRWLDEVMLYGPHTRLRVHSGVDLGDDDLRVDRLWRPITAAERTTGVYLLRDEDRQALGGIKEGDTIRMDVDSEFVTFIVYRKQDSAVSHKDAGKEVTRPRMQRSMLGAVVTDTRMRDGSIKRSSDIGQPAQVRPKLKLPGRRGN